MNPFIFLLCVGLWLLTISRFFCSSEGLADEGAGSYETVDETFFNEFKSPFC